MRGYVVDVTAVLDENGNPFDMFGAGLLMNVYDNDELILKDVGALNFELLTPDIYVGEHTLSLTYYRESLPEVESEKFEFYRENFTLPVLGMTVEIILLT